MPWARQFPLLLTIVLLSAVGAGCGQDDDRREIRAVADEFSAAIGAGDGDAACARLSPLAVEELESQESAPCPEAILELELSDEPVSEVLVYITNGAVERADGERGYLGRTPDGWRLTAVGCRFEDGKPRDRPADCEVEA